MKIKWPHSGNVIIGGFICMIILMSCLVYATTFHNPDMVSDNYYEKEIHFDDNKQAESNTDKMNFPVELSKDAVFIIVPSELVNHLKNGEIKFYCPSDSKQDKSFPLVEAQLKYPIFTNGWKPLEYIVMITSQTKEKKYFKEYPLQVK